MGLWRVLSSSDVGVLVGATVDFQMGRISRERAGWSREDRAAKSALLELAIHFVDIVCTVAGAVAIAEPVLVDRRRGGGDIVRFTASGRSTGGAHVTFNLGYTDTAQRTRILLEFERSTIEVGFFPDGCRVMPRRSTPVDEATYSAIRFARFIGAKLPPRRFPVAPNAAGHFRLYRHHLRRALNSSSSSVCDLSAIAPTMETIYALAGAAYGGPE
jgi:predicted dehydrogenase